MDKSSMLLQLHWAVMTKAAAVTGRESLLVNMMASYLPISSVESVVLELWKVSSPPNVVGGMVGGVAVVEGPGVAGEEVCLASVSVKCARPVLACL